MRIDNPIIEGALTLPTDAGASGSFSGSFEGDGSGLTGVAPIGGTNINVVGTTVNLDDSITLTGITAVSASFVLQTFESSSTIITSGSNIFGDQAGDTQQFTGSILLNGPFVATSTEATINGAAIVTGSAQINHDSTTGFVANEHVDHSSVSITAGSGLTGGGDLTTTRTINIGAGTGIDVAADAISVDVSDFMTNGANNRVITATGTDAMNAEANLTFDGSTLTVTGTITETSARRFKKNIISLEDSLSKVLQLNPVEFDWIKDDKHDVGLIAEEVNEILPDLVQIENEEVQGIHYSRLTAVLIGAIKELTARVEELENK